MRKKFVPPNKIKWTPAMDSFLKENYGLMNNKQLSEALKLKLTCTRMRLYELGYKRMEMEYWTDDQVKFLKENYTEIGDVEIAEIFQNLYYKEKGWRHKHIEKKRRYLNLKRTEEQKAQIKERNRLQGRFSINHYKRWLGRITPEGGIKIWNLNSQQVKVIKVGDGFMKLSHFNWIKSFGPIPENQMIIHADKDTLNCEPSNLLCITKAENARRNTHAASVGLSDNWIAGIMSFNDPELRQEIINNTELIDLKRSQIQLNRTIKNELDRKNSEHGR